MCGIIYGAFFNISHFRPIVCSDTMAQGSQQDSGEERVRAKFKLVMNLFARTPSFVSSSTSLSPGKRYYGKQDPWKSVVADDRSGQLDRETENSSTDYSILDYGRASFSQEWKTDGTTHDRSGQLDRTSWRMVQQVRPHHEATLLDRYESHFVIDQGNLIMTILKKRQILKISSWEVMKQNL